MAGSQSTGQSSRSGGPLFALTEWVADLGLLVTEWITALGDVALFSLRTLTWLLTRLPRRETLMPAFYQIGVLSLPVIALTGTFIGMVLAVQSYQQFRMLSLESRLGAVINMTLFRELGPVLAATMLAGTPAVSFIGAIGAALTLRARRSGVLIALLMLPLYVPTLLFGIEAIGAALTHSGGFMPAFLILLAISLASVVLGPLAAALALRLQLQ